MPNRLRSWSVLCLAMLALLSLDACSTAPQDADAISESLVASGGARGGRASPLSFSAVMDPLGVGDAAATRTSVVIRSRAAYRAAFGHAPPADVQFGAGDVVIFYSDGVKPTGGYEASVLSVVQVGRTLLIATHISSPGANCVVTDALTSPYALVKVRTRGRTVNARFQHLRSTRDCEPPMNSCDGFECPDGEHCELQDIVCITTPCDPVPACVADSGTPPFCGGIAGFPCPGAGECVDNPNDDCDPNMGGADCGGLCECNAIGLCVDGSVWDSDPAVCGCKPAENPCNLADCPPGATCEVQGGEAVCVPTSGTNPCAFTLCPINTNCEVKGGEAVCVPTGAGGEACGPTTCGAGMVCCNSSCGICTPPDGACIQIACL